MTGHPTRTWRLALECLVKALGLTGDQSLLDRRPEDWMLLARQVTTVGNHTFRDIRAYLKTFFVTLHRALLADPWAEDLWLWRGGCYRPRYLHIRRQRFMRTDWQRSMSTA